MSDFADIVRYMNALPDARIDPATIMRRLALIDGTESPVELTAVNDGESLNTRLRWSFTWTADDGERYTETAPELHTVLWAAEVKNHRLFREGADRIGAEALPLFGEQP